MKLRIKMQELQKGLIRASCPSLPGCVVYGQTQLEARQEIEQAIRAYLASMDSTLLHDPATVLTLQDA